MSRASTVRGILAQNYSLAVDASAESLVTYDKDKFRER